MPRFRLLLVLSSLLLFGAGCLSSAPAEPAPVQGIAITHVTCDTVDATRTAIHQEYSAAMGLVSDAYWRARQGFQSELQQCLDGLWNGGPCDAQWDALQQSYQTAMGDVSNDDAYNDYKAKKADWDACHDDWDAQWQQYGDAQHHAEATCQQAFQQKVDAAQQAREAEEQKAAQKRDADLATLDEFERQCRASNAASGGVVGSGNVIVVDDGRGGGAGEDGVPAPGPIDAGADACTGGGDSTGTTGTGSGATGPRTGHVAEHPVRDVIVNLAVAVAEDVTGTPLPTGAINDQIFAGIVCTKLYARVIDIQGAESDAIWSGNRREEIRLRRELRRYTQAKQIWCAIAEGRPPQNISVQAQEVNDAKSCQTDADCGPPVCCGETEIGRYYCNEDGECSSAKDACPESTVCSGRPAACVEQPQRLQVIGYNGTYVPIDQLHRGQGEECDEAQHWHANTGAATAVNGEVFIDPGGCGFGTTSDVPVMEIVVTKGK